MRENKPGHTYRIVNPNKPPAVEALLREIALEKLEAMERREEAEAEKKGEEG